MLFYTYALLSTALIYYYCVLMAKCIHMDYVNLASVGGGVKDGICVLPTTFSSIVYYNCVLYSGSKHNMRKCSIALACSNLQGMTLTIKLSAPYCLISKYRGVSDRLVLAQDRCALSLFIIPLIVYPTYCAFVTQFVIIYTTILFSGRYFHASGKLQFFLWRSDIPNFS